MNRAYYFFLFIFPFAFLSSHNLWSNAFGTPNQLNVVKYEIEKEFKCEGIECLDLIPFKSEEVKAGSFSIYSGKALYKEYDSEFYNTALLLPLREDDIIYTILRKFESYFESNDLLTILGMFFLLSIFGLKRGK